MWRTVVVLLFFIIIKNDKVLSFVGSSSFQLSSNNFDEEIKESNYFVMFYTPGYVVVFYFLVIE